MFKLPAIERGIELSKATDKAYTEIRQRILSGELPPNSQLTERELADICGVSRTPIKDALRRLEAEMLVRRTDTQRCFIPDWTSDRIEEVYSLRSMVEGHAAMRAAHRITETQIAELQSFNAEVFASIKADGTIDMAGFRAANAGFHRVVMEAAHSERLLMMRNLLFESPHADPLRKYDRDSVQRSHADHEELIWRFQMQDATAAKAIMENHIRHAFFSSYIVNRDSADSTDHRYNSRAVTDGSSGASASSGG